MKKLFIGLVCGVVGVTAVMGAISIGPGTPVTQDFDSIGNTATATLPTDWKVNTNIAVRTVGSYAEAATATARVDGQNVSASAGNGIYNLGAPTDDATDRAIGWLSSASATKSGNLYVQMVNSGGSAITSLDVAYNVEKYRNGSNAAGFSIQLYYSTDGTTWTSAGATFLTSFPADADNAGFATPPGATVAVSGTLDLSATPIAVGGNLYLAWNYSVTTGTTTSNSQLLGVDDISISIGGPATFSVSFDKTTGFTVDQNTSDAITATAANGTPPYTYSWSSTLGGSFYTAVANVFTILATAPVGSYSAQVIATDNAAQSVTNSINFSVQAPAPKYAISIVTNAPVNGTVTTTPATEAEAGQTVTINATAAGGYAVGTKTVVGQDATPITVTGITFTMPAQPVTVTVTFVEASTSGALIISQYYEGASFNKWIEIYNPGSSAIDLAAGGYRLGQYSNEAREGWKTDVVPGASVVLSGTISAGGTYLVSHGSAALPTYVVADQIYGWGFNGDDSVVLYTGTNYAFANVVDAFGLTGNTAADKSFVRTNTVTVGVNTDFNAAEWIQFSNAQVDAAAVGTNERLGYHSTGAAVLSVSFDKTTGFTVDQNTSDAITATAANGTPPYSYAWSSTLGGAYYTAVANVFTILATAPVGSYSAQVIATDNAAQSVTNSLNFSVQAPQLKYAITITAPVNGTVTTTPATEAEAGQTVTINATAAGGYAVGTKTVVGQDATPITVTGITFTMPAQPVTVTVTFVEFTGSSLIFSEVTDPQDNANAKFVELYNAGGSSIDLAAGQWYLARQANGGTWANVALTGTVAPAGTYVVIYSASNFATAYPAVTPDQTAGAVVTGNGDDGYFLYSGGNETAGTLQDAYGVLNEDGTGMAWEYTDGRAVRNSGVTAGNPTWTAGEWTITRPATAAEMTPGVHPDGAVVLSVSFDKTDGFTVDQGSSDAITATAANGTAPYSYAWSSTLGGTYYTAVANVFTILATAPVGSYSAQVIATDNAAQSVTNSLNFSVQAPQPKYGITITAPVNGTVTTTPATEAEAGQTVTINATAAGGYAVGTKTVVGQDATPITVTGITFTMPAQPVTVTVTFVEATGGLIISQYTETESGSVPKGIEIWNASGSDITFDAGANLLDVLIGVNGVAPVSTLTVNSGTLTAGDVWVIGTEDMTPDIVKAFTFNGDDAIVISLGGVVQDVFGDPGTGDPGTGWAGNGVQTYNQNIQLKAGITTGDTDGWTDPSERFELVSATPSTDLTGFGVPPGGGPVLPTVKFEAAGALVDENIGGLPIMVYKSLAEGDVSGTIVLSGTAIQGAGADYTVDTTNFTMNGATTSAMFVVTINDDVLVESSETIILTLANVVGGTVVAPSVFTMTITDNDAAVPTVVITGDLSVTVDELMGLTITLQNGTAADWFIDLKDPDGADDYSYGWTPGTGAFTLTPAKVGNYTLTATAVDAGMNPIDSDTVVIEVSEASTEPEIPPITFVAGTGFTFQLPPGTSLVRVEGADTETAVAGNALTWTTLNSPTDYTLSGTTVTIKSSAAMRRLIRIVVQ